MKHSEIIQNELTSRSYSTRFDNIDEYTYFSEKEFSVKELDEILKDIYMLGCARLYQKKKLTFNNNKVLFKYIIKLQFGKD
ncbi:unnamed protein product [marine sediment metagenome]|uniref:Uncharacterized protein n=1 Tax=marine sediment metagenome TaxID=412755 RepID=X1DCQ6_9ZZZZ